MNNNNNKFSIHTTAAELKVGDELLTNGGTAWCIIRKVATDGHNITTLWCDYLNTNRQFIDNGSNTVPANTAFIVAYRP